MAEGVMMFVAGGWGAAFYVRRMAIAGKKTAHHQQVWAAKH